MPGHAPARVYLHTKASSCYGPNEGLPELRVALRTKVAKQNGLADHDIFITNGGNQAYMNLVISLVDESDKTVLFAPAYFDHIMSHQMVGGAANIIYGECDPSTLKPSVQWLRNALAAEPGRIKMVTVVNPNNPTGVLLSKAELQELADVCADGAAWLVLDNTYEDFANFDDIVATSAVGNGAPPTTCGFQCVSAPHVVHIFSFSKAYGMMGWRIGYIVYHDPDGDGGLLGPQLLKTQDTMAICVNQPAQHAALCVVNEAAAGGTFAKDHIAALQKNRELLMDALSVLPPKSVVGGFAIYFWARLPPGCEDDVHTVEFLVKHFGVLLVPGSSCGVEGHVRIAFGNVVGDAMVDAAGRLKRGLTYLVEHGLEEPGAPR
ncbi:hypothetical protein FOA52_004284 [Chlamydomonas sp. UWO 241]|nr:hypothetical protein FOA52_004284 [Chlamydomonas sp. UWO 241]